MAQLDRDLSQTKIFKLVKNSDYLQVLKSIEDNNFYLFALWRNFIEQSPGVDLITMNVLKDFMIKANIIGRKKVIEDFPFTKLVQESMISVEVNLTRRMRTIGSSNIQI